MISKCSTAIARLQPQFIHFLFTCLYFWDKVSCSQHWPRTPSVVLEELLNFWSSSFLHLWDYSYAQPCLVLCSPGGDTQDFLYGRQTLFWPSALSFLNTGVTRAVRPCSSYWFSFHFSDYLEGWIIFLWLLQILPFTSIAYTCPFSLFFRTIFSLICPFDKLLQHSENRLKCFTYIINFAIFTLKL